MKKKDPVKKNMDKLHKPKTHKDKTKYNKKKNYDIIWRRGIRKGLGTEDRGD